jgi:hypothetical protein
VEKRGHPDPNPNGNVPVSEAPDSPGQDGREGRARRAGRIGRRVAIGIYLVGISYMVVVGMHSVVRQVFWPELPASAQAPAELDCEGELEALRVDLLKRAADHVESGGEGPLGPWLEAWDQRALLVSARCDHPAMHPLESLRYRIETTLRRFDREEARLSDRVHRLIVPGAASDTRNP